MKKKIFMLTLYMAVFAFFSASYAGASGELVIVGTGAGMPVIKAIGKAFTEENPGITVTVPKSIGSGGGIKAVGNDDYILGRIARDINNKEKKYGLKQVLIVKIPIVFFVNTSVSISNITHEQACRIYDGTTRKWEKISGGKGKIRVIKREDGDSSLAILIETLPGFKDISLTPRSKTTFTDQSNIEACIKQKNSIAFGTWADIKNKTNVRALKLGGIPPSDPKYPCMGPLFIVYKEKNYNGNVKKFVEFISTNTAKKAIIEAGGLPTQ